MPRKSDDEDVDIDDNIPATSSPRLPAVFLVFLHCVEEVARGLREVEGKTVFSSNVVSELDSFHPRGQKCS